MRIIGFIIFAVAGLIFSTGGANSAYLHNMPVTVVQPGGDTLHCFASGDEYYNWLHDANGYTILRNSATGYYEYATLKGSSVVCTGAIAGRVNPASLGIPRHAIAPPEVREGLRSRALARAAGTAASPTSGTINNIVIFVRFSDQGEFTDPLSMYDELFNGTSPTSTSLLAYYKEVSYDQLTINSSFYPAPSGGQIVSYQDIYPRAYYLPYDSNLNPTGYQLPGKTAREDSLLLRAVSAVEDQVPDELNIDSNDDGLVDNICFVIEGDASAWSNLLWPHRGSVSGGTIKGKGTWFYNLNIQGFIKNEGSSVICHEMFHTLGAPDLYHYSFDGMDPVGGWDLMAFNSTPPQHMGAYMKFRYGHWIDSIPEISSSDTYTLQPLTSATGNAYKITSDLSSTEYYVVEYRQKTGVFESGLPGTGMIAYRINTAADGAGNATGPPDEVYVYRQGGTLSTNGDYTLAAMSANSGRTVINDVANPTGFLSNGVPGGLNISDIGTAGSSISFLLGGPLPITLSSFEAAPSPAGAVTLHWMTASETNNYGFLVERKTGNDTTFTSLPGSFIPGHGTTLQSEQYQYTDLTSPHSALSYRLKQINLDGTFHYSEPVNVDLSHTPDLQQVPAVFSLHQNYPNPFNPSTVIEFSVAKPGRATLAVYNTLGESVATLFDGSAVPGTLYRTTFDGTGIASGVYFCRLSAGESTSVRRLLLIR